MMEMFDDGYRMFEYVYNRKMDVRSTHVITRYVTGRFLFVVL